MNNAKYGRAMENLRYRISVKLVNNKKDYSKCTSKPSYMPHKILENSLATIRKNKLALKLNKCSYIGLWVLELSKLLMYEFHYDYIKNKYGNKSKLLSADSDSLMCEIKAEYVNEDFSSNKKMFDVGNYLTKSKNYDRSNKLNIGKMKDESGGVCWIESQKYIHS